MSLSANMTMRVNSGAPAQGAKQLQPGDVVQFDATSYAGWGSPAAIYEFPVGSYPKTWPCPTGWTNTNGSYKYTVNSIGGYKPPAVTFPGVGGLWGTWLPRLVVNGVIVDTTAALEIRSPYLGLHETAAREEQQFGGPDRGSMGPDQDNLLAIENAVAALGGGPGGGGVALGVVAPVVVDAAAAAVGNATDAAPTNHKHSIATGAAVDIALANSAGASTSLARADHVHKLPFSALAGAAALASGPVDWNGIQLVNLGLPTSANHAATKSYVDSAVLGLDLKMEVRGASLANQPLSGPLTEDGITYANGDRYLAKNQVTQRENGIRVVNTSGPWGRAPDADSSSDVTPGMFCFVLEGTVNRTTGWALFTPGPIVLDTTNLVFTQIFNPVSFTAGTGLTLVGNAITVLFDADGSIITGGGGGLKVGALATDAQHGSRGGGGLHSLATGGANGFLSSTHFTLLSGATASPTSVTLGLRGANGELLSSWVAPASAAVAQSGFVRVAKNVVAIAARTASGAADAALLATDGADVLLLGDFNSTAGITARMGFGGTFKVMVDAVKPVVVTASAVSFFGEPEPAGGGGVLTLNDATIKPTGSPGNSALIYSNRGGVTVVTPNSVVTTVNPSGDGVGGTLKVLDQRLGYISTTNATPTVVLSIEFPATLMAMTAEFDIIGYVVDSAFHARRWLRARRVVGAQSVSFLTATGVADSDDIGGCSVAAVANGNAVDIVVTGKAATTIGWMVDGFRVRYFKP